MRPWTAGNKEVNEEIAHEQVIRWTPAQIKAAEKQGYFEDLSARCLKNIKMGLLEELSEEGE